MFHVQRCTARAGGGRGGYVVAAVMRSAQFSQPCYSRSVSVGFHPHPHLQPQQQQQQRRGYAATSSTTSDSNNNNIDNNNNKNKTISSSSSTKNKRLPLGSPIANVTSLDHLVLTVKSLEASIQWYTSVLGMRHVMFDTDAPSSSSTSSPSSSASSTSSPSTSSDHSSKSSRRHALTFNNQKINLHESGREFEPKATSPTPGSADLCFIVSDDVEGLPDRLDAAGVAVLRHSDGGGVGEGEGKTKKEKTVAVVTRTGARGTLRSVYLRDPDGNLVEYVPLPTCESRYQLVKALCKANPVL